MKQRAPALPDSATFQQLWDALGSKLIESSRESLLYTQGVAGSNPAAATCFSGLFTPLFTDIDISTSSGCSS